MLYKAIVEKIINNYTAAVRIPLIHRTLTANEATPSAELPIACIACNAGLTSPVQPGDIVIVGFDNDDYEKPIILGHLYREVHQNTLGTVQATDLNVTTRCDLPAATTIGAINGENLSQLAGINGNIQKQLDFLQEKIQLLEAKVSAISSSI